MKKNISLLLKNLCCSQCKSNFDESSVKFITQDGNYNVIHLTCQKCGKDFGTAFLKLTEKTSENDAEIILNDIRNTPPISCDDVLDAHKQIKDFEKNWNKFIND